MINQIFTELIEIVKVIQKVKLIYKKYQFVRLLDTKEATKTVEKCIQKYDKKLMEGKLDKENKKHIKKYIRPKKIKDLFGFMYQSDNQN